MKAYCNFIGGINTWVARVSAWVIIPLTGIVAGDVVLRYVFNRPTTWSWDITVQLLGVIAMLSGGYVILTGGNVAVDAVTVHWSPRTKAAVDLVTSLFFFFAMGVLLWTMTDLALASVRIQERFPTFFAAPIYPLKIIMVVGTLLMLLRGIVKFSQDLGLVISGEVVKKR